MLFDLSIDHAFVRIELGAPWCMFGLALIGTGKVFGHCFSIYLQLPGDAAHGDPLFSDLIHLLDRSFTDHVLLSGLCFITR